MDELNTDIKAWVQQLTGHRIVEVEESEEEEKSLIVAVQEYIRSTLSSGKEAAERGRCPWVLTTVPPPVLAPPSTWDDFFDIRCLPPEVLDKTNPATFALLTDSLSTPVTIAHAAQVVIESNRVPPFKDEAVIHVINPQMKDMDVAKYLELLYLTGFSSLTVVLVGPEVPEDMDSYSYSLDGTRGVEVELPPSIVEIGIVFEGSPAATAGLKKGDLVTRIGDSIDARTFVDVGTSIVPYIGANMNKPVPMTLFRIGDEEHNASSSDGEDKSDEKTLEELVVEIVPSVWEGGKGVLGCTFVNPSHENFVSLPPIRTVTVTCFRQDYSDYRKASLGQSPDLVVALDSGICYSSGEWMEALSILAQDSQVPCLFTTLFSMEAELDKRIIEMCAFDVILNKANPFKSPLPSPHPLVPMAAQSYCYASSYMMVALPKAKEGKYGDNPDLDKLVDYVTGKVDEVGMSEGTDSGTPRGDSSDSEKKGRIPSILSKARKQMRMRHNKDSK